MVRLLEQTQAFVQVLPHPTVSICTELSFSSDVKLLLLHVLVMNILVFVIKCMIIIVFANKVQTL